MIHFGRLYFMGVLCSIFFVGSSYRTWKQSSSIRSNNHKNIMNLRNIVKQQQAFKHWSTPLIDSPPSSFINDELRPYTMQLHAKNQAKEGQQPAEPVPYRKWEATRADFMQYLVDSLHVYQTFDEIVRTTPSLYTLNNTGMERVDAIQKDIQWLLEFDSTLYIPTVAEPGKTYSAYLKTLVLTNYPGFICHFYNQYFAHTAGGMRIGLNIADKLLGGKKLHFYTWLPNSHTIPTTTSNTTSISTTPPTTSTTITTSTDNIELNYINELKLQLQQRIDAIAVHWTLEQRQSCRNETANCFYYGQKLLSHLRGVEHRSA